MKREKCKCQRDNTNMLSKQTQTDKVFDNPSELAEAGVSLPKVKRALSEKQKTALKNLHAKNAAARAHAKAIATESQSV